MGVGCCEEFEDWGFWREVWYEVELPPDWLPERNGRIFEDLVYTPGLTGADGITLLVSLVWIKRNPTEHTIFDHISCSMSAPMHVLWHDWSPP